MKSLRRRPLTSLAFALVALGSGELRQVVTSVAAAAPQVAAPAEPPAIPAVATPISILELQPFRQSASSNLALGNGLSGGVTLINLNPTINAWYLLRVLWRDGSQSSYHLENPQPRAQSLALNPRHPEVVELL